MPEAAIGPIIGAGVSAIGGLIGGGAQSGAVNQANEQAQRALAQQRADLAPFRTAGTQAVGATSDLLGLNGTDAQTSAFSNFHTDPGYQFQLDQGLRAVDAGAAAKGILRSGATLKAEQTFGTGLADQSFNQYYNRLFGLAGLGENAAAGGASSANTSAAASLGAGNAQSSIYGNMASGLGSSINGLFSNPNVQNSLFGGGSPAINTTFNGFAPAMVPGQVGVGGFTAF
jgi:hypothetical protein